MIEVIRLRLLLSFDSLTEFCGKMIPSSEMNANPAIKQRVLSLLRMFKTHCWFLIFLNTKTAVISNKRSRPFFLFFNLIGWLMTSDWQLVNRASLSYFFHETYVGSFDQCKFIPNWLFFQEQEKTHRWLIVPLQISSLGLSLTNRILFDGDLKKALFRPLCF